MPAFRLSVMLGCRLWTWFERALKPNAGDRRPSHTCGVVAEDEQAMGLSRRCFARRTGRLVQSARHSCRSLQRSQAMDRRRHGEPAPWLYRERSIEPFHGTRPRVSVARRAMFVDRAMRRTSASAIAEPAASHGVDGISLHFKRSERPSGSSEAPADGSSAGGGPHETIPEIVRERGLDNETESLRVRRCRVHGRSCGSFRRRSPCRSSPHVA